MHQQIKKILLKTVQTILCIILICSFTACTSKLEDPNNIDPFETTNRGIFHFNQTIDKMALKPAGTVYNNIVPKSVNHAVGNFFENLAEPANMLNDILQGKMAFFTKDLGRFIINSTIGCLGFADVATNFDLSKHDQSFAATLAHYGCVDSPYLMMPFFGPSNVCALLAMPLDVLTRSYWFFHIPVKTRNITYVTKVLNQRAATLKYTDLIDDAIDPYVFVRNAYLQHNKHLRNNNRPIEEQEIPDYSMYIIDDSNDPQTDTQNKSTHKQTN